MFNDIRTARRSAWTLSRSLMVATAVIAIGAQFAVITSDDIDARVTVVAEFDPFA